MTHKQFFIGRTIGFIAVLIVIGVGALTHNYTNREISSQPDNVNECENCQEVKGDVTVGVVRVGETSTVNGLSIKLNYLVSGATTANVTLKSGNDTKTLFLNNDKDATAFDSYKVSIVKKEGSMATFKVTENNLPVSHEKTILNKSWVWKETLLPNVSTKTPPKGKFVITFNGDQGFTSTTDCNRFSGHFILDNEILSIGPIISTKMYCQGSIENEYAQELGAATSHTITGHELRINLLKDSGTMIFTEVIEQV